MVPATRVIQKLAWLVLWRQTSNPRPPAERAADQRQQTQRRLGHATTSAIRLQLVIR